MKLSVFDNKPLDDVMMIIRLVNAINKRRSLFSGGRPGDEKCHTQPITTTTTILITVLVLVMCRIITMALVLVLAAMALITHLPLVYTFSSSYFLY